MFVCMHFNTFHTRWKTECFSTYYKILLFLVVKLKVRLGLDLGLVHFYFVLTYLKHILDILILHTDNYLHYMAKNMCTLDHHTCWTSHSTNTGSNIASSSEAITASTLLGRHFCGHFEYICGNLCQFCQKEHLALMFEQAGLTCDCVRVHVHTDLRALPWLPRLLTVVGNEGSIADTALQ